MLIHGTIMEFDGGTEFQPVDGGHGLEDTTEDKHDRSAPVVSSKFMEDAEVQFATKRQS